MKKVILFFAAAQSKPMVRTTQVSQSARITQGVASGELTGFEARQLNKQQNHQKEKECIFDTIRAWQTE